MIVRMNSVEANPLITDDAIEQHIKELLEEMTVVEKLGQMSQVNAGDGDSVNQLGQPIRDGRIGSILNEVNVANVNEMQRIAFEESRLRIPLLVGRDVIHGFRTVLPIPIGQAATWNPDVVREGARLAASEAAAAGVNWTFAPMIDITRDPRWGRIAESPGEDPYLASQLAAALVEGFQGDDLAAPHTIAATAKHFAGYGASEAGRDYATTNIPENELRNVHLVPFHAAVDAGVAALMTSFSDLNGIPATGNEFLIRQVLRKEWGFRGVVVSDWHSVPQLSIHGLTSGDRDSAAAAIHAGVDMEMASHTYIEHGSGLVETGTLDVALLDEAVANILRLKFSLGLFECPYVDPATQPVIETDKRRAIAKQTALESIVLLRNENHALPLSKDGLSSVAIIGPLADAPYEQLGTWIFDGDPDLSVTPFQAIRDLAGDDIDVRHVPALESSRSQTGDFKAAFEAAEAADVVLLMLGEESILSGESHSRADISLPGAQTALIRRVREAGKSVIAVIMAGRPLTLTEIIDDIDAVLFAWHPGTMGGPAIADILFGIESPSGKLPVTFPRMVGQVPIYYGQKNTGKPATADTAVLIDEIPVRAPQTSVGNTSYHLDAGASPLFPFGFGLSYTWFEYSNIGVSASNIKIGESLTISADVSNCGAVAADEVVQLYVRDPVANVTRPVRELKGFRRVRIKPGQTVRVDFELHTGDLAFYGRDHTLVVEPGEFHAWIGGNADAELRADFTVSAPD